MNASYKGLMYLLFLAMRKIEMNMYVDVSLVFFS